MKFMKSAGGYGASTLQKGALLSSWGIRYTVCSESWFAAMIEQENRKLRRENLQGLESEE
jgi:hypothetical protein